MRVINVIYVKNCEVEEITSFGVFEEQLSNDVVEQAEKHFANLIKKGSIVSDEEIEAALDNGIYEGVNYTYSIVWSDI
jgi:hypothetical protein